VREVIFILDTHFPAIHSGQLKQDEAREVTISSVTCALRKSTCRAEAGAAKAALCI
jgi:hypothetical protein